MICVNAASAKLEQETSLPSSGAPGWIVNRPDATAFMRAWYQIDTCCTKASRFAFGKDREDIHADSDGS